jgi:hypothetical protein
MISPHSKHKMDVVPPSLLSLEMDTQGNEESILGVNQAVLISALY